MNIGIFGGAFNPIHNGHLYLAEAYLNGIGLDKILFIPTYKPPHKSSNSFASGEDRVNMLRMALDNDSYEISTIEFEREDKSYTYDTLKRLREQYPDDRFYLIIGSDQLMNFDKWYRYKEILEMVTLCSFPRRNDEDERLEMLLFSKSLGAEDCIILDEPPMEVSSSEIRSLISENKDASALLPPRVLKYIKDNNLYV